MLKDPYSTSPLDVEDEDQFLITLKVMIVVRGGKKYYRIYRCTTPRDETNIPQGARVTYDPKNEKKLAELVFGNLLADCKPEA